MAGVASVMVCVVAAMAWSVGSRPWEVLGRPQPRQCRFLLRSALSRADVLSFLRAGEESGEEREYGGKRALDPPPLFPDSFLGAAGVATVPPQPPSPLVGGDERTTGDSLTI
jgi:hypothetical protein